MYNVNRRAAQIRMDNQIKIYETFYRTTHRVSLREKYWIHCHCWMDNGHYINLLQNTAFSKMIESPV